MRAQKTFNVQASRVNEEEDPNINTDPETIWMRTGDMGIMDEQGYLQSMTGFPTSGKFVNNKISRQ